MLRTRLLTAAVAIPAIWLIVWKLPAPLFAGFIVAVTASGLFEYFAMALPEHPVERVTGIVWGLVVGAGIVSRRPEFWGAGLGLTVIGGLVFPLVRTADLAGAVHRLGLTVLGVLYVGFVTPHIVLLRHGGPDGWRWVLFTVFVAMGSDSGGYFTGRAYGRRKLLPAVSPSKTVEGSVGAIAGAMFIAVLCRVIFFPRLALEEAFGLGDDRRVSLVLFAEHLDVAAEGHRREGIFRLAPPSRENDRPEADRETLHEDAEPLGHHEVAELVHEDQHSERDGKSAQ